MAAVSNRLLLVLVVLGGCLLGGCTFSSTAKQWNGLVGPGAKPVRVKTHTNVGVNFAIVVPFLGSTTLPEQIDELTREIAAEQGDEVRMIESSSENYWYGFPPFTWLLTPVITSVAADYHPSAESFAGGREAQAAEPGKQGR